MEDKKLQLPEYEFQYGYTDRIIDLNIKSEDNSAMSMKYSFIPSIFRDLLGLNKEQVSSVIIDGIYGKEAGVILPMNKDLIVFGDSINQPTELMTETYNWMGAEGKDNTEYMAICRIAKKSKYSFEEYQKDIKSIFGDKYMDNSLYFLYVEVEE